MKHFSFKSFIVAAACIVAFVITCFSLFSFTVTKEIGGNFWEQLGISEQQGTNNIKESFVNGYLHYYGAKNVKNIAVGDRAAVVKDILNYCKTYLTSAAFKKEYAQIRENVKPHTPVFDSIKSKEQISKEKVEETKKSLKETEENIKKLTPEIQKGMQSVIVVVKENLKKYEDTNSQIIEILYNQQMIDREYKTKRYNEDMERWQKDYPENFNDVIKVRLQKYLSLAATVDFNAQLMQKNGKVYFVDRNYEAKNYEWKMIFRAGKEVYDAAKPFAEQWMSELK